MSDGQLDYEINAKDNATPTLKKVNKGFADTDKGAQKMGASMVAAGTLIADAAKMAMGKVVELGKAALKEADEFGEFGRSVNLSAAEVAGLDRAFVLGGSSTEGMKAAMLSLSGALDPEKITKQRTAVEQLGVSVKNSDGTYKSHKQLLLDISDAYQNEESATRKAAIGKRIFGSESQKMNDLLSQGSAELQKQVELYGNASGYTDDLSSSMAAFNDAVFKAETSMKGLLTAIASDAIFQKAIQYVSDLGDEWIQFLADLNANRNIDAASDSFERLTELQERYLETIKRSATYGTVDKAIEEGRKLAGNAIAQGSRSVETLNTEALALRQGIDALKERGNAQASIALLETELARVQAAKNEELKKESIYAKNAADALKKKKESAIAAANADKGGKKKEETFDNTEARKSYEAWQKSKREALEKRLSDEADADDDAYNRAVDYDAAMKEIRSGRLSAFELDKQSLRDWYEEKREIVGQDAELEAEYKRRMAEITVSEQQRVEEQKNKEREAEIAHQNAIREYESQRLANADVLAQATFDFLNTATAGYKTLGGIAKGVAYAEAWWNTYVAVTKAMAQYGPIMGIAMGGLAMAKGVAMTAKINSQKFANSGIVGGSKTYGDQNIVYANSEEMYLSKNHQADLFKALTGKNSNLGKLLSQNTGTGKTMSITINGMMDNKMIRKLQGVMSDANSRA